MKKIYIAAVLGLLLTSATLLAQTPTDPHVPNNPLPQWVLTNQQKRTEIDRATRRDPNRNITIVSPKKPRVPAPDPDRTAVPATPEELEEMAKERKERGAILEVDRHYRKDFESFLNLENTSIARLFADKNCGMGTVVTLAELERCADVPEGKGGGSMFSFRCVQDRFFVPTMERSLERGIVFTSWDPCATKLKADMQFKGGKFIAGDGVVQGIMADLGDVNIETVDLNHKAFDFIDDYDPKQSIPKIAKQDAELANGINAKGFTYTNAAPVKLNSTYVLRSVLYRYHEEGELEPPVRGVEVRVAFRVVGQEPDGSVIIIWRELDRQYPRRKISDN